MLPAAVRSVRKLRPASTGFQAASEAAASARSAFMVRGIKIAETPLGTAGSNARPFKHPPFLLDESIPEGSLPLAASPRDVCPCSPEQEARQSVWRPSGPAADCEKRTLNRLMNLIPT